MKIDEQAQPDEYLRLSSLIQFGRDFQADFGGFLKQRNAQRYSVKAKRVLQLLGLSLLIFIAISLKRKYFG